MCNVVLVYVHVDVDGIGMGGGHRGHVPPTKMQTPCIFQGHNTCASRVPPNQIYVYVPTPELERRALLAVLSCLQLRTSGRHVRTAPAGAAAPL